MDIESDGMQKTAKSDLLNLNEQADFLYKLDRVFETAEGKEVLEWILDKCYFHQRTENPRRMGMQDFANVLFFTVNKANSNITQYLLSKWQMDYRNAMTDKRKRSETTLKGGNENAV